MRAETEEKRTMENKQMEGESKKEKRNGRIKRDNGRSGIYTQLHGWNNEGEHPVDPSFRFRRDTSRLDVFEECASS